MNQKEPQEMRDVLSSLTPQQMDIIEHNIAIYERMLLDFAGHPFNGLQLLYTETDAENIDSSKEATCKKGCAFCCSIKVVATQLEADMIVSYCGLNNIPIDTNKLEQLQDLDEKEYMFSPHKRCTFLDENNACKIYTVRPFSCRNYYVKSDPQLCDTDKYPHGHVCNIMNLPASLPAVAVMKKYPHGNFAKLLINSINNTNK